VIDRCRILDVVSVMQQSSTLRWLRPLLLLALVGFASPVFARPNLQRGPAVQSATLVLSTVNDWEAGNSTGLLVTNNDDGELRLSEEATEGVFTSAPFATDFAPNAVGATWQAELLSGTSLALEVRARTTPLTVTAEAEESWSAWQPLVAGDALSQKEDGAFATADVRVVPADTRYLQLRVSFKSEVARASALLTKIEIAYLRTATTPPIFAAGFPRQPILFGAQTLTARPSLIARAVWAGQPVAAQPERADPRGVILHQIDAPPDAEGTLALLRALANYQTEALEWDDMPYHFLIDAEGNLFEGRAGGPTSAVSRLAGGDNAVHIALIGAADEPPTSQAQAVLVNLLAWLGQAYGIDPTGEHEVVVGPSRTTRPNIVGHADVAPGVTDPYTATRALLPQLRTQADQSTVRARWYFAEGNIDGYSQRFSFFNPSSKAADANVTLLRDNGSPVTRIVPVPAGGRADLVVNDVITGTSSLPAIVESSAPLLAERTMGLTSDIDGGPGINRLSRIWYFAEGSTEGTNRTFLALFNPQPAAANVTLRFMLRDGQVAEQKAIVPANQRLVVSVNDILPGQNFGTQIVSNQPLAVERTMRFGENSTGLHTGRGIETLSRIWYFAEGTTQGSFDMRVLVLNPNEQRATVAVSFMGPDGTSTERNFAIPPRSQLAINVDDVIVDQGISTMVESDRPVAVERALLFNNGQTGSVGAGATAPAYTWRFVDGRTSDATYFLLFANPGRSKTSVSVDFVFGDGGKASTSVEVPAQARYTMAVHELYPNEDAVAATVRSTQPIIAERSFFPGGGLRGGQTTLGLPE
jgi:hypothetical protein